VPHAEVDEDRRRLELAADAEPDDVVLGEGDEIGVVAEDHAAVLGLRAPGDHVEQCRLARAVRADDHAQLAAVHVEVQARQRLEAVVGDGDRKSTRLNSSHGSISYAVFCLKKKTKVTPSATRTSN